MYPLCGMLRRLRATGGFPTRPPWEPDEQVGNVEAAVLRAPEREVVLKVDFDLLHDDGCAWISVRFHHGPRIPDPGEVVYLMDGRGSGCVGTVSQRDGWDLCVLPDWDTFTGERLPAGARLAS